KPKATIFRGYPAIAQTRWAEQMQREGWFDHGWEIDAGRQGPERWFPEKVIVGEFTWSSAAWSKALKMGQGHGRRNGLYMDDKSLAELRDQGKLYRDTFGVGLNELNPRLRPDDFDGELRESFQAHHKWVWYHRDRDETRYAHFRAQAEGETEPDAIAARE